MDAFLFHTNTNKGSKIKILYMRDIKFSSLLKLVHMFFLLLSYLKVKKESVYFHVVIRLCLNLTFALGDSSKIYHI